MMGRFVAQILGIECVFMIPALVISIFCEERAAIKGFALSILIIAILGGVLYVIVEKEKRDSMRGTVWSAWVSAGLC